MITVSNIQGTITAAVSQNPDGFLDRGPALSDTIHENPAAEYLFLNPGCCGAVIDSDLWDLLTDQRSQPETKEASNV